MDIVRVNWSGGKDSTCAVIKHIQLGHYVKDEQIDGLRSTVDKLKNELRQSHDSYYSLLIENKRLNHENCAQERENKKL